MNIVDVAYNYQIVVLKIYIVDGAECLQYFVVSSA